MLNVCTLMGRIVHTPELRTTQSGTSVVSFTLAVERSYAPKGQQWETDFIDCVAWRNTAEFIYRYFGKGQLIAVAGEIQTRNFEDRQGNKRKAVEVNVSQASFTGDRRDDAPRQEPQRKSATNGMEPAAARWGGTFQGGTASAANVPQTDATMDNLSVDDLGLDDDLPF